MQKLYQTVVNTSELNWKVTYHSINVPNIIYGYELWLVTEIMRLWIQPAEMSFLLRVAGLR